MVALPAEKVLSSHAMFALELRTEPWCLPPTFVSRRTQNDHLTCGEPPVETARELSAGELASPF
jgi:hypothetical protein